MSKIRSQIATKQAEMRILKLEEETINKLSAQVNDQLNRLKIEAMSFNSALVDKSVKNVIQPSTSSEHTTSEQMTLISPNMPAAVTPAVQTYLPDHPQEVNLVDLDLMVPPTAGTKSSYTYNEESSDEDEEANECLLLL